MNNEIKGAYGALFKGSKQVGGFFYWVKSTKPPIGYYTSDWWLFEEIKECDVILFDEDGGELKQIQPKEKVKFVCPHRIFLDKINKGTIVLEIIK